MISLRKTASEMDRVETLRACFAECYRLAIRATAEHAIELDPSEAADFREQLETLATALKSAGECEAVSQVQSSFRTTLRGYRDQAQSRVEHLRKEVEAGAAAVAAFTGAIASNGSDHQAQMEAELNRLRKITGWENVPEIRRGLEGVIAGITEAVAQMQRSNQMTIAQLQDEIRTLHHSMEAGRRAAATDATTGAWTRPKTEQRITDLLKEPEAFRALLISVTNFKRLEGRYSPSAVEATLKELIRRMRAVVGMDPPIGRWSESEFLVLLDVDASAAMMLSRESSLRLSGSYPVPEAPCLKSVQLEVATGLVERAAGTGGEGFLKKLDQLSCATSGN